MALLGSLSVTMEETLWQGAAQSGPWTTLSSSMFSFWNRVPEARKLETRVSFSIKDFRCWNLNSRAAGSREGFQRRGPRRANLAV